VLIRANFGFEAGKIDEIGLIPATEQHSEIQAPLTAGGGATAPASPSQIFKSFV
jgi:hypothetical protein